MKKLIILLSFLLIPVSAICTDWNYVGKLGDKGYQINIKCLDSNNCFVINYFLDTLRVYHSSDQGRSWQLRHKSLGSDNEPGPSIYNPEDVSIPDTNHIFISFWEGLILKKSTDGGRTFSKIVLKDTLFKFGYNNILMYDSLFGFATYNDIFCITDDGWKSWKLSTQDITPVFDLPYFIDRFNIRYFGYANDNITYSNYNFLTEKVNDFYYFYKNFSQDQNYKNGIRGFCNVNNKDLFIASRRRTGVGDQSRDVIIKSNDNGYNWGKVHDSLYGYPYTPKGSGSAFGLQNISCYDENNCMAVGAYGKVVMSNDGGKTWVYHPEGEIPFKRSNETVEGPLVMQVAWAGKTPIVVTLESHVYRYEGDFFDFGTSVEDIQPINTSIFPNPSSEKISLDLVGVEFADLVIYDILGNEIMSIPNYTNKSEIDISNLSIGTYTIQIQTSTGSISRRFIKIKE